MTSDERQEIRDFSWGAYVGFPFFFARNLTLPAILHLIIVIAGTIAVFIIRGSNPESVKWVVLPFVIVEIAFLTFYGFRAGRMSWASCRWEPPYKFIGSSGAWAVFGRLLILLRVLNVTAMFLQRPGGLKTYPSWFVYAGLSFIILLLVFVIWRTRGAIWAVALNALKESVAKLEVVILFLISLVFVILFNSTWLIPAVRSAVLIHFENNPQAAEIAEGRSADIGNAGDSGDVTDDNLPKGAKRVEEAFTERTFTNAMYRLRVQAAASLFGEIFVAFICIVIGINLVAGEIQRGVVLTVLPKPIGRGEYILGKILGGWIIATACFEVIAIITLGFALPYMGQTLDNISNILHAMLLMPIKFAILITLVVYFSLWLPEAVAGFFGFLIFVAGHMSEYLLDIATDEFSAIPILSQAVKAVHVLIPNLSPVTSTDILDPNATDFTSAGPMIEWTLWAFLYFAVIMALTIFTFRKRSL